MKYRKIRWSRDLNALKQKKTCKQEKNTIRNISKSLTTHMRKYSTIYKKALQTARDFNVLQQKKT